MGNRSGASAGVALDVSAVLRSERPTGERVTAIIGRLVTMTGKEGLVAQAEVLGGIGKTTLARYLEGKLPTERIWQRILAAAVEKQWISPEQSVDCLGLLGKARPKRTVRPTQLQQLPPSMQELVGRTQLMEELTQRLRRAGKASHPVVLLITGTAGVGKSTTAIHLAYRTAVQFPTQIHLDLRGFSPDGEPMGAAEAVRKLLDYLGAPGERVPASFEDQVALYRRLLAKKRVLVVLDNASSEEHVRPLLPGSPGCTAVVTSRRDLAGLVAQGAHPVHLDLFTSDDARDLLVSRLGYDRVAHEPSAAAELVELCARLPLALSIIAARAATRSTFSLAVFVEEIAALKLDVFDTQDPSTSLRAAFSWSYDQLSDGTKRLFRLLGLHPGPDISTTAAASLAGVPTGQARQLLSELATASLIKEQVPNRFALHDLLRSYAAKLADLHDPDTERKTAIDRLLNHYLHTANAASSLLLNQFRDEIALPPLDPGVTSEPLDSRSKALAWFTTEHLALLAAIRQAADTQRDTHTWPLAWNLVTFLRCSGFWHDWEATQSMALAAAQRLGNPRWLAQTHRSLGGANLKLQRYDEAESQLSCALDLFRGLDDPVGQAHTHLSLAATSEKRSRFQQALGHAQEALRLYHRADHVAGHARALNTVGWFHAHLGDGQQGLHCCTQALAIHQERGDRSGQAATLDSLAFIYDQMGEHLRSTDRYQRAVDLYRDLSDRGNQADTLIRLGQHHAAWGDHASSADARQQALEILEEINDQTAADQVRAELQLVVSN